MDSQPTTPKVAETAELSDLEDRSRFLKSLGFARDRMTQGGNSAPNNTVESEDDGMMLSSNFEDDLELPGSPMLMEPTRSLSEPFGLGEIDLEKNAPLEEQAPEIETRFAQDSSFDLAGVDDAAWSAVNHRLRPEPADWRDAEAKLEADLKKKTIPPTSVDPVISSSTEAEKKAGPPPLEDEQVESVTTVVEDSSLDREIEKAVEPPSNDDEPPSDDSLTVNCPSCDRGLTLQPEHLGIPGSCVWCETPIIAAKSGVDQTVGVFVLAVDEPISEEEQEAPAKPAAEMSQSSLADLPIPKSAAPKTKEVEKKETPVDELEEKEKVEIKSPAPKTQPNLDAQSARKPDVAKTEKEEKQSPENSLNESAETVPDSKNNFPWNAPAAKTNVVPAPIEGEPKDTVDSESNTNLSAAIPAAALAAAAVLPKLQDTDDSEVKNESSLEEKISAPKAEESTVESSEGSKDIAAISSPTIQEEAPIKEEKQNTPPPLTEEKSAAETPAVSSNATSSPFDLPATKDEAPTQNEPSSKPVQASPFDLPAPKEKAPALDDTDIEQIKSGSPFDLPSANDETPVQSETSAEPIQASPFDLPAPREEKPTENEISDEPIKSASPFDLPELKDESSAQSDLSDEPIQSATPFDPPADTDSTAVSEPTPLPKTASPFDPLPEVAEPSDSSPLPTPSALSSSHSDELNMEMESVDPIATMTTFGPSTPKADIPHSSDSNPLPEMKNATEQVDSAETADDTNSPKPLPWDLSGDDAPTPPATEIPASPEAFGTSSAGVSDLPGIQNAFPASSPTPMVGTNPTNISQTKTKSSGSKRSRTAVTIALLGLISGAGIASFFLPVGDYIKSAKSSWADWFETKVGAENTWEPEAQPTPANEPVAIPAPAPAPEPAPTVRTATGAEPDPFNSNDGPGS